MRSQSSYMLRPEQAQYSQNYRIKLSKASAHKENHTEADELHEEATPMHKARSFVLKKSGKLADESTIKQSSKVDIHVNSHQKKYKNDGTKENRVMSALKIHFGKKGSNLGDDKHKSKNPKFHEEIQKIFQNPLKGYFPRNRTQTDYKSLKGSFYNSKVKENPNNESVVHVKLKTETTCENQTNYSNLCIHSKDITSEKAKKLLYLENNEIKSTFNFFNEENRKLETKIKQMRKERERAEKDILSLQGNTFLKVKMNNFAQTPAFNDKTNALKQVLKERKDRVLEIQNQLKDLRKNLKDESILALTKESLDLAGKIQALKEEIQIFNSDQIDGEFIDTKNLKGQTRQLILRKNEMTVILLETP
jgi:hypothetical protein